jgi:hypothetical protein
MGYSDIIAHEIELLPPEKQVEILDFIAFLKARYLPVEIASVSKAARESKLSFEASMWTPAAINLIGTVQCPVGYLSIPI